MVEPEFGDAGLMAKLRFRLGKGRWYNRPEPNRSELETGLRTTAPTNRLPFR